MSIIYLISIKCICFQSKLDISFHLPNLKEVEIISLFNQLNQYYTDYSLSTVFPNPQWKPYFDSSILFTTLCDLMHFCSVFRCKQKLDISTFYDKMVASSHNLNSQCYIMYEHNKFQLLESQKDSAWQRQSTTNTFSLRITNAIIALQQTLLILCNTDI